MSQSVSFVVPAYNESKYIKSCIGSIEDCCEKVGIDYEIIIVDNGSTDDTASEAENYNVTVYSIERSSVSYARNFGVLKSKFPIIAFIDGDVKITEQWGYALKKHYKLFMKSPLYLTGNQCLVPENGSWIERHWFSNLEDQLLGGANIITSKLAFDEVGGFDVGLKTGEDYDFCLRCINQKFNYFTDKEFKAIHLGFPHTLKDFLRRECWHGEGDFKSFKQFFSSTVALIAVLFLLFIVLICFFALAGYYIFSLLFVGVLLFANQAITLKRFYRCGLKTILVNSFLNLGYFLARIGSLYRAFKNRRLLY